MFIQDDSFNIPETLNPGDTLDLEVIVENTGSTVQRNVQITALLEDIDIGNSDIVKTSSNFILEVNEEHKEILRFRIPDEASDGSHRLEIRVEFDDGTLIELEEVTIVRPDENVVVNTHSINPGVAKCEDTIYAYLDIENLGKFDEEVFIKSEILGTGIRANSGLIDLNVDNRRSKTLIFDIRNLPAGDYEVEHSVEYAGDDVVVSDFLKILSCEDETDISVNPIDDTNTTNEGNETTDDTMTVFGQEVTKTTAYLAGSVGVVFVLIFISLFFI